jgi:hypothetical protein
VADGLRGLAVGAVMTPGLVPTVATAAAAATTPATPTPRLAAPLTVVATLAAPLTVAATLAAPLTVAATVGTIFAALPALTLAAGLDPDVACAVVAPVACAADAGRFFVNAIETIAALVPRGRSGTRLGMVGMGRQFTRRRRGRSRWRRRGRGGTGDAEIARQVVPARGRTRGGGTRRLRIGTRPGSGAGWRRGPRRRRVLAGGAGTERIGQRVPGVVRVVGHGWSS